MLCRVNKNMRMAQEMQVPLAVPTYEGIGEHPLEPEREYGSDHREVAITFITSATRMAIWMPGKIATF